jgi:hypothetical protein
LSVHGDNLLLENFNGLIYSLQLSKEGGVSNGIVWMKFSLEKAGHESARLGKLAAERR